MTRDFPELNRRLWVLAASPGIWAAHLMVSYATAAIWCAKLAGVGGSLWPVRVAISIYTVVAVAGIAVIGWRGWRRHRAGEGGGGAGSHHRDAPGDRHRFLGFATLLLSGLSGLAVLYAVLPVLFLRDCR